MVYSEDRSNLIGPHLSGYIERSVMLTLCYGSPISEACIEEACGSVHIFLNFAFCVIAHNRNMDCIPDITILGKFAAF